MSNTQFLYKVTFRPQETSAESAILSKFYKSKQDADDFAKRMGDRVVEQGQIQIPEGYPEADLDFS
jgi:hypothetical protein